MEDTPIQETPRRYNSKYKTEEERYEAHKKASLEYYHRIKPDLKPKPAVSSYTPEYRKQYYDAHREKLLEYQRVYRATHLKRVKPVKQEIAPTI